MEIKNKHVFITGANRGIGRAVALRLAEDKAHLHLVQRKFETEFEQELKAAGAQSIQFYEVDLENKKSVSQFLEKVKDQKIDIFFNNAGQLTGGLLEDQPMEDIERMLQVNIESLIRLTRGILPQLLQQKSGKIINHGSVSSIMNFPCASTYSAAKAAVYAFTKCLEVELNGTGVSTLILITPGINTEMYRDIPKLYGAHLNVKLLGEISAKEYAEKIRMAILEDLKELNPTGSTGVGLFLSRHFPNLFARLVETQFKRK